MAADRSILQRFLLGDAGAIAEVRALIGQIVSARGYYIPAQERADVAQDAFLSVWSRVTRPGFAVQESLRGLVREIAHRRCVDWMRDHGAEERVVRAPRNPGSETSPLNASAGSGSVPGMRSAGEWERPDSTLRARESLEVAGTILRALRESHRELIRLRLTKKLGYREIARLQGRSEEAVRQHWCDCLKEASRLRREIDAGRIRARRGKAR